MQSLAAAAPRLVAASGFVAAPGHPAALPRIAAAMLAGLLLLSADADRAAAQSQPSCYPYCDYTHYYGPYDYTYLRRGLYCYPRCRPDGVCAPDPLCVVQAPRGRITVRSLAGAAAATTTTATFYDPSVAAPRPARRMRARR